MSDKKDLLDYISDNNGIITADKAEDIGFSRGSLKYMTDTGRLEKVEKGIYILPETMEDDFFILQSRFKKGIYCLETALFLHDLTDRTPQILKMTFPLTYNLTSPKNAGILCCNCKKEVYSLGICEMKSPYGNRINVYNAERTLCDLLKGRNHTDIQIISEAFRRYLQRKDRNINLLSDYGKRLRVENKLHRYLEVLL